MQCLITVDYLAHAHALPSVLFAPPSFLPSLPPSFLPSFLPLAPILYFRLAIPINSISINHNPFFSFAQSPHHADTFPPPPNPPTTTQLSVGNDKLSDLRMQLLKTGVIKIAITGPTEFDGIPKEMAMFNREFLPDLSRWCLAQGFELVVSKVACSYSCNTPVNRCARLSECAGGYVSVRENEEVVGLYRAPPCPLSPISLSLSLSLSFSYMYTVFPRPRPVFSLLFFLSSSSLTFFSSDL